MSVVSPPTEFQLVWSDEFNGEARRSGRPRQLELRHRYGPRECAPGWGNSELQFYTDRAGQDGNVYLDGQGRSGHHRAYGKTSAARRYTSGRIRTKSFARNEGFAAERRPHRSPHLDAFEGEGLWSAFWMLGASTLIPKRQFASDGLMAVGRGKSTLSNSWAATHSACSARCTVPVTLALTANGIHHERVPPLRRARFRELR